MSKIYYNLNDSEFMAKTEHFMYFFSSALYLSKFMERYKENRKELESRLSARMSIKVKADDYFDFLLYSSIEKRGFRVESLGGLQITCLNEVTLSGEIMTLPSLSA